MTDNKDSVSEKIEDGQKITKDRSKEIVCKLKSYKVSENS